MWQANYPISMKVLGGWQMNDKLARNERMAVCAMLGIGIVMVAFAMFVSLSGA
jgi:hypothetical protein